MTLVFSRGGGGSRSSTSSSSTLLDVPLEHLEELFCSPARQALFDLEGRLLVQRQSGGRGQQQQQPSSAVVVESLGQKSNNKSSSHYRECLCRLRGNLLLIAEVKPGNNSCGSGSSSCDNNNSHHPNQQQPPQVITVFGGASGLALVLLHRFEIKLVEERTTTNNNSAHLTTTNGPTSLQQQQQQYEFVLSVNNNNGKVSSSSASERYHFIAGSRAERDHWIQSIYLASFDFLRSIQRALRETLVEEKAKRSLLVAKSNFQTVQPFTRYRTNRFVNSHHFYRHHHNHHQHLNFLTIHCTSSVSRQLLQQHSTVEPFLFVKVFARLRHVDRAWSYLARTEPVASRAPLFASRITLPSFFSSSCSLNSKEVLPFELKFELIKSTDGELDNAFLVAYAYARKWPIRQPSSSELSSKGGGHRKKKAFSVALISVDGSLRVVGRLVFTLHQLRHSSLVSGRPSRLRASRSLESLYLSASSCGGHHHHLRRSSSSTHLIEKAMDGGVNGHNDDGAVFGSSNIFSNTLYKRFTFKVPTSSGANVDLLLEEFMSESKFAFSIPQILIKLYAHDEEMIIAALEALLAASETPPAALNASGNASFFFAPLLAFHRRWLATLQDYLGEIIHFMAESSFRSSRHKAEPCLQFVPTNFHRQSCRAVVIASSGSSSGVAPSSASPFFTVFTHGSYSAHHLGYERHGGMQSVVSGKNESLKVLDCWRTLKGRLLVVLHSEGRITASLNSVLLLEGGGDDLPLSAVEPIYRSVRALCDTLGTLLSAAEVEEQLGMLAGLEAGNPSSEASSSVIDAVFHLEPLELVYVNIQASLLGIEHKLEEAAKGRGEGGGGEAVVKLSELESFNRKLKGAIESLRRIVLAVYLSAFSQLSASGAEHHHRGKRDDEAGQRQALERLRFRHQALVSQAVTAMVIFIMDRLAGIDSRDFLTRAARTGFILVQHEVWLSCFQEEQGMLEDMVYSLAETADHLLEVVFVRARSDSTNCVGGCGGGGQSSMPTIEAVGEKLRLTFYVPEEAMPVTTSNSSFECRIKSIIFNIGVNEAATVAERLGYNSFQRQLNRDNFAKLKAFARRFYPQDKEDGAELFGLLAELEEEVGPRSGSGAKNLRVMQLVEAVVRRLGGIRATCCKSAKDRTGMSVTLQEVRYATAFCDQVLGGGGGGRSSASVSKNEKLEREMLDAIRRDGTRLDCCFKNIGVRKYAFNRIQLATYPRKFRPPKGTYYNTVLESAAQT